MLLFCVVNYAFLWIILSLQVAMPYTAVFIPAMVIASKPKQLLYTYMQKNNFSHNQSASSRC